MTLKKWIELQGGAKKIAPKLGIGRAAIGYWLRAANTPTASVMFKIVRLSKGKVSYKTIVEETLGSRVPRC